MPTPPPGRGLGSMDGPPTPKSSGSYQPFLTASVTMREVLDSAAMAYEKRADLGHDYGAARLCRSLAARASLLADGFDAWTRDPPSAEARGHQIEALFVLRDEARPLIERAGMVL